MKHKSMSYEDNLNGKEDRETENKITYESIIDNFDKLTEKQRLICKLFYLNNLSIKEIKRITNMPEGTIKSHLHRSRKALKKLLQQAIAHGKIKIEELHEKMSAELSK